LTIPEVEPGARLNRAGLISMFFGSRDDPTHQQAWEAVRDGKADLAVVRNREGYILFRSWRITQNSWAWQTSQMGTMAFAPYSS
jgi:hypothetical protein